MEDRCDMDVSDLVVVLVGTGADFSTSDKNVSKLSCVPFSSNGLENEFEVLVGLNVESCIPLAFLGGEGD